MFINEILDPYKLSKKPLSHRDTAYERSPKLAWETYYDNPEELKKREHLWATNPEYALNYALTVIKGPFPLGEAVIAKDPKRAYQYAYIIKGRWPPGEAAIAKNARWAYEYAHNIIGGRWPPGEAAIAKDPKRAYQYAHHVIGGPWKPGSNINEILDR